MSDDILEIEGGTLSLAELANVQTGEIEEKRYVRIPPGLYRWKVKESVLTILESGSGTDVKKTAAIQCTLQIVNAIEVPTMPDNGASLVEAEHKETFRMQKDKPLDFVGYFKAFASDAGYRGEGKLQELTAGFEGHEFIAPIVHRVNRNDTDRPFVNLDREKIKPVQDAAAA